MPDETFQLITAVRTLDGNVELAEALAFPEISALDDADRKWRVALAKKAKLTIEDHEIADPVVLFRRHVAGPAEVREFEMFFEPAKRQPAWKEPVRLRVQYVHWTEGNLHHAFAPVFRVHVFATDLDQIPARLQAHIRLTLPESRKQITLRRLAEASRFDDLRVDTLEVTARRKTAKQIESEDAREPQEKSTLAKVADPLDADTPAAFELDAEVAQLAEALSGPNARSVLIVGAPGSGKTALVRELARRKRDFGFGQTPFWSTTGARLMTGQLGFGMWQKRCQKMCREAARTKSIVHLNHLAELLEVGQSSRGDQNVGGFLRPWITRGDLLAIAECTSEELSAIERQAPHLAACFHRLTLNERNAGQTRAILRKAFEGAAGKPTPVDPPIETALDLLRRLHERYATYSANPGRPLRFLRNLLSDRFPEKDLSGTHIISAFSRETGLPRLLLDDDIPLDLEATRLWFEQRIVGQPEAIGCALDLLAMIKARLARPRKPLASFLFIGPTGTGKTEMAKAFAEFLFGDAARLARFDLNEFNNPISVQRLIGGPAAGATEGLLTARVREQPFSVLLLDEFEKADPSFFDLLLQILGDGRLTDASGRVADFCNSVIVMTSNLGAQGFQRGSIGFRRGATSNVEASDHFSEAVRKFLRPEIYNRIDAIVPFRPLTQETVLGIARRHLEMLRKRDGLRSREIDLRMDDAVAERLAANGYDPRYGARPLKRTIDQQLLAPMAAAIAPYQPSTPLIVTVRVVEKRLVVSAAARPAIADLSRQKTSDEILARDVIEARRRVAKLSASSSATKLDDEIVTLAALERRALRGKWKTPALQERLTTLPKLRHWRERMNHLEERARALESDVLGVLYSSASPDSSRVIGGLSELNQDVSPLRRELVRLQTDDPDEIVLAFFSERGEMLFQFARAYSQIGTLVALDSFVQPPGERTKLTKLIRETPKKIDAFFEKPPERVIGIVMQLRGDLFRLRFCAEAGLHIFGEAKGDRVCLIETSAVSFEKYEAPAGIERAGAIKARNAPTVRTYLPARAGVDDERLGFRPWTDANLQRCIAALSDERLEREIDRITG